MYFMEIILENSGGASCCFEDLSQYDLNFLILKFNVQHIGKM